MYLMKLCIKYCILRDHFVGTILFDFFFVVWKKPFFLLKQK